MKFSEIKYTRPDFDQLFKEYDLLIDKFSAAKSAEQQFKLYDEFESLSYDYNTQFVLVRIHVFLGTDNDFYRKELREFTQTHPLLTEKYNIMREEIFKSPFKDELADNIGYVTMLNYELMRKAFTHENIDNMREESELVTKYNETMSKLTVDFDGKTLPLPLLIPYKEDVDRQIRKNALIAEGECYNTVKDSLDDIFDRLVKNRTTQAKILGFENFIELGYARMRRNCYDKNDVKVFKEQVLLDIVPIVTQIYKNRSARLGIDDISYYDLNVSFADGSPKLQIFGEELIDAAKKMFNEMSPVMSDFFKIMVDNELMDVYPKIGKSSGGFCSYLTNYKYPFIFANFNNTVADLNVFTHETGHAYARYICNLDDQQYYSEASMDINESCSMAMEFLTAPWHEMFFKDQSQKYMLTHAENALILIAYACQVDEFQEQIYANPDLSPAQRDELWLEFESKFRPGIHREDIPFYSVGAGWQRQQHIFKSPFYYIDYALSQIVAIQFHLACLDDYEKTLSLYNRFVKNIHQYTYCDLLDEIGFKSPLKPSTIKPIINDLVKWMGSINI